MTLGPMLPLDLPAITPLTSEDARSGFHCEHEELDRFLAQYAGQQARREENRTWVQHRPEERTDLPRVLGYYTLSSTSVKRSVLPLALSKRLPDHPVRAVLIGRLARDERCRGMGVGEHLLHDAHGRALQVNALVAGLLVIVDAKDARAAAFYERFGYAPLVRSDVEQDVWPRRFYVTMRALRASYGHSDR